MKLLHFMLILSAFRGLACQSTLQYECDSTVNEECLRAELNGIKGKYEEQLSFLKKENEDLKQQKAELNDIKGKYEEQNQILSFLKKENEDLKQQRARFNDSLEQQRQELSILKKENEDLKQQSNCENSKCNQMSESGLWISGGHRSKDAFSDIFSKELKKQYHYDLSTGAWSMAIVKEQLWVAIFHSHTILILNVSSFSNKPITHPNMLYPFSLDNDYHDHVFVCSETGLHLFDEYGSYLYKFYNGAISDIQVDCNLAYMYSSTNNNVITLQYNNNTWLVNSSFLASKSTPHGRNTLAFVNDTIYICSHASRSIETYSLKGDYIAQHGNHGINILNGWPLLCGVDSQGSVLVCDQYNGRFVTLSSSSPGQVFNLPWVYHLFDVIINTRGDVWVLHKRETFRVTKFTV